MKRTFLTVLAASSLLVLGACSKDDSNATMSTDSTNVAPAPTPAPMSTDSTNMMSGDSTKMNSNDSTKMKTTGL